jgi:solute carrier family 6 GABA transporter-like protein 1
LDSRIYSNTYSSQGVTVDTVVNSGPGLVFITYPEVVLKLPGGSVWAIIFFFMLVVRNPRGSVHQYVLE